MGGSTKSAKGSKAQQNLRKEKGKNGWKQRGGKKKG